MKIYTLTLTPAYDVHIFSEGFSTDRENHARITSYEAGGKGLNVCRALLLAGTGNTPVFLLGRGNDGIYRETIGKLDCEPCVIPVEGRIRENMTIHDENGQETRICFDAPATDERVLSDLESSIDAGEGSIVTFTGRMPAGIPMEDLKAWIRRLQEKGAKIVIDSKSFSFSNLKDLQPWLIKPNREEISDALGCEIKSREEVIKHADKLADLRIENVLVSLGEEGAVLFAGGRILTAVPASIRPVSTIGAGDSMIAGFINGEEKGMETAEKLRNAVAFGTAACLAEGTMPPGKEEVERIRGSIRIEEISK